MELLFYVGIIMISGIVLGKIVSLLNLPKVTGYLIVGIIIGPSVLGIISSDVIMKLGIISEIALGFISYGIGKELNFKKLRNMGSGIVLITFLEAFTAVILVDLIFIFILKQDVAFSIILGAIAAATAPASTLMVIKQYRARGPLVDTLLPVVAMDDIMAIIALGISLALCKNITCVAINDVTTLALIGPIIEMIQSILIGILIGFIMNMMLCYKRRSEELILCVTIAMVFIGIGIAKTINISTLLTSMAIGATISNISSNERLFDVMDKITPPIFLVFFTLSGAELDLSTLKAIGIIGIVYVLVRAVGKILGARIGAKIIGADKSVQKYLGMTLMPQAGVAIGLAVVASASLPEYGQTIRAIILSATVIYELIGPYLTKIAIFKSGEVN